MRRWMFALATAVVASGVGVSVNVATELGTNVWAWVAVGVATLAAAGVALWVQSGSAEVESGGAVTNSVSGTVTGSVVQARDISGPVNLGRPEDPRR
ncbi:MULTISPECIES: hypothetical protein [unclassified Crossiella]|uniref:hypothetical protein n=1 Tax=unclassified Crossiella TaxID=2620835 RepID=UPI001FFE4B0F|nr:MULTISPECIES: hypothetical protein [unclassified Crossiella]MCK2239711.1 hypothetical protein [Crossiella sp. S99.2]MCK2252406.1 hypothetical protein [Crossiella sp. S99.1]